MAKAPQSPLLGYNNNVRHKNRVFHIQTEDSGVKHPHIITHLFMDGGRILKSVKMSYAEHVGMPNMADIVRGMMKEQHKAMFIALRDGQFDHVVEPSGPATTRDGSPSGALPLSADEIKAREILTARATEANLQGNELGAPSASMAKTIDSAKLDPPSKVHSSSPKPAAASKSVPPPAVASKSVPPPAVASKSAPPPAPPKAQRLMIVPEADDGLASAPPPPLEEDTVPEKLELDLGAIAPRSPQLTIVDDRPPVFSKSDAPPPQQKPSSPLQAPPGVKRPFVRPIGSDARPPQKSAPPEARPQGAEPWSAPHSSGAAPRSHGTPSASSSRGRYAPTRPASIFALGRREVQVSDKSLDEVILSYLAEDLEEPPPPPKR